MRQGKVVSVSDVENILVCLPGVQKARVVVNDWGAIEEIHILTGLDRNPKQIVRDVQSALKAQWDITVDRRKVSVAQLKSSMPVTLGRLRYAGLEVKTETSTGKGEVCVTLERASEEQTAVYVGKAETDGTEGSLLLAIARATCFAVNLTIQPPNRFFPDDVAIIQVGPRRAVAVLVTLVTPRRNHEELLGAALIRREPMEACVRATLDALNRRLEVLPVQGTLDESAKDSGEDEAQPDVSDADQLVAPTPETESQDIRY
ncbi:MAG TPA: hypothetical protein GX729_05140 [Firmicutes bacterium]|jgi:hypothetical protein|nr:hypothetical protein [Bacillota bacterium]